ncbi:hypothetical protein ACIA8R_45120 [Nonomuraea sp. NPDC051191]|uniref:hypothetical protein n=1 Tax=Nonomuraea sp. NPDC051191 TaxID=3364372 RepID=UPI0037B19530
MASFTAVTTERVTTERVTTERVTAGGATAPDVDPAALGAALTWLGERLHYLATLDVAPSTMRTPSSRSSPTSG